MERVRANLASRVKKGKLSQEGLEGLMRRLTGTLTYDGFGRVDMVIEAAIEDVKLKQQIFADLERACK
jgi:enoyl-CoA hydratase/3-hydroxyacyl-CoA dehydrogenase